MTQGKTLNSEEAANAIDRDLSTPAATPADNGEGWLQLKFGRIHVIHKIIIFYRFYTNWYDSNNWCAQSVSNFKACVENHNNADVSVYQGDVKQKSCGTLQLTYGLEQSDQIYTLICNTEGDMVKLTKSAHAGHAIVVYEVVLSSLSK